MALTNLMKRVMMARRIGLTSAPVVHGQEGASQSYNSGAFLTNNTAGQLVESTSPIDASTAAKRSFGIAVSASTGTTSTDTALVWLTDSQMFEINLSDATAGTHTLVQTDQWKVYPITKDTSSGNWYLDANAVSSTGGGIVVEFRDPVGTVDARVYSILTNTARGNSTAGSGTY